MATKWYFTNTTESGSYTEKSTDTANKTETNAGNLKQMTPAKGAGLVTPSITNTTTSAEKWFFRAFVSPPLLAQTVASGTWTFRAAPIQSNANLSHKLLWYAYVLRAGSNVATITGPVNEATASATSSTSAGREHAVAGVSSFSVQAGDQIVVEMWSSGTSTMTTGYTHQPSYGGASEITDGSTNSDPASNVEFSGTINISNAAQGSASGTCTATAAATVHKPVEFGTIGALANGTTSLSVAYPSSIAAGDLLVLAVVNKYPSNAPSTPAGWTLVTNGQGQGGSGASGLNAGQVYVSVYTKTATGSESGSLSVTVTSGNASCARMLRYVRYTGSGWDNAATNGSVSTVGTWAPTAAGNPGITVNDVILAVSGSNSARIDFTTPALTATSATISAGTQRAQDKVTDGDDITIYAVEFTCTAGTASANPAYSHTDGSSGADDPAGATVLLRMRYSSGTANAAQGSASGTCTATGNATATFKAAGSASGNATVSGHATVAYKAVGSASGTATATGAAGLRLPAQGSASGTATASGTAQIFKLVSGAASGTCTAAANATATYAAAGSASGTATVSGNATSSLKAAGSASGTATAAASATVGKFVSGSASGNVSASGAATAAFKAASSASGSASASGTAHTTLSASSSASGTATATATADVTRGVSGSASCTATVSAVPSLLLGAQGDASGSVTATGAAFVDSTSLPFTLEPTTAVELVAVVCTMDDAPDTTASLGTAESVVATMAEPESVTTSFARAPSTHTTAIEVP